MEEGKKKKSKGGRPRKIDSVRAQNLCIRAIEQHYGSLEAGIQAIIAGREENLKKFIWSHALGNVPTENTTKLTDPKGNSVLPGKILVEVVRTEFNKDVKVGS